MKFPLHKFPKNQRGGALIMTLLIVSMMSILAVAFLSTMQIEQQASHAYANTQRAKLIAQGAVSHSIDLLRSNIPEPAQLNESAFTAPGENWMTNPGQLTVVDSSGRREIPLHTGEVTVAPSSTDDPNVHSVDLNEPIPGETAPMIAMALNGDGSPNYGGENPTMRVKWQSVIKNPGEAASEENPMIGRYAFWMDDESSKLNFNTAAGKPARGQDKKGFWNKFDMGMMNPDFIQGGGDILFSQNPGGRPWALGKSRSVNLDVLFDDTADLNTNRLLGHAWLKGFSRYPEAIVDFVELSDPEKWYRGNKFNLTFYSRSPEFNAFGRPRLFTTNTPLSLEGGPLYQQPFVYREGNIEEIAGVEPGILHLHSLMGNFGYTHGINDGVEGNVLASGIVNQAQLEMLMRYFRREWPGYDGASIVSKYGELEAYQIALSMIQKARFATTTMRSNYDGGSIDWALRTTSTNYTPHNTERPGANPERYYWPIETEENPGVIVPMLPQTAGPHIMEIQLVFKRSPAGGNKYRISYQQKSEIYMHGMGPVLKLHRFPTKVDYIELEAKGGGEDVQQQHGIRSPDDPDAETSSERNWNDSRTLGRMRARAGENVRIGPLGAMQNSRNRIMVASTPHWVGPESNIHIVEFEHNGTVFDSTESGGKVNIKVKWRMGMGVDPGSDRPRQMIPLGEEIEDTLEADFEFDLRSDEEYVISWQITDPRLSWSKDQWVKTEGQDGDVGTPGEINDGEPEEFSTEKSKFRYLQRGHGTMSDPKTPGEGPKYGIDRPDEYNSRSRVATPGYWTTIHTGIQNLVPYRTIDFGGGNSNETNPPDYVILDLMGMTEPLQHDQWRINNTLPDAFSTISYMHSTAGQINLNSKIYPQNDYFDAPVRKKPLEGVFKHLRDDAGVDTLISGVIDYQETKPFEYTGELSKVAGFKQGGDATEFDDESILRNMYGCLTTKSNCFGVWGVSQVVKKVRGNEEWETFEDGDVVQAEKRFHAIIERYIWPGKDGVPGNGHLDSSGVWDRGPKQTADITEGKAVDSLFELPGSPPVRATGGTRLALDTNGTYPAYDGPQKVQMGRYTQRALGKVVWNESTLEDAYNPPQPVIKYRVVYFKYLDE